jgi:hypothetical protein
MIMLVGCEATGMAMNDMELGKRVGLTTTETEAGRKIERYGYKQASGRRGFSQIDYHHDRHLDLY